MENSPLSPKLDKENQEEERNVEPEGMDVTLEDEGIAQGDKQQLTEPQNNNSIQPPSSVRVDRRNQEVLVVDLEAESEEKKEDDKLEVSVLSQSFQSYDSSVQADLDDEETLLNWNESVTEFPLWHTSVEFREMAKPFLHLVALFWEPCRAECRKKYKRNPTVVEFANFSVSQGAPIRDWYAEIVFVNSERRGWPLQYNRREGKVFVKFISLDTRLETSRVDFRYVVDDKLVIPAGPNVYDLKLWQLDIVELGKCNEELGDDFETVKNVLGTVRKLMDYIWFPSDPESFITFYNHVLYERLELLFGLEYPTSTMGAMITDFDRSNIISAIKHYHRLKNSAFRVYPSQEVEIESEDDEDIKSIDELAKERLAAEAMREREDELDPTSVKFQMDMKRHTLELSFILSSTLRPILSLTGSLDEYDVINPEELILVISDTNMRRLKYVYEELEKYGVQEDANIRILPDLETALKKAVSGTTVFVTSGNYNISGLWKLSDGGSIIGLKTDSMDVTISPSDAIGDVWMLMDSPNNSTLNLKNLSFAVDTSMDNKLKTIIHATMGQLNLQNCVIRDNNSGSELFCVKSVVKSDNATVNIDDLCLFTNVLGLLTS